MSKTKNNSLLVDVVMPVYNQEQYVAQAIESVLGQTTSFSVRLLIGDDCSSDLTSSICQAYSEKYPEYISYFRNEKNLGIAANYQLLFDRVEAKYIAILEGDDYWTDPNKLEKQIASLESNERIVLSYSPVDIEFEDGSRKRVGKRLFSGSVYSDLLATHNFIYALSVVFRTDLFKEKIDLSVVVARGWKTIDYFVWLELAQWGEFSPLLNCTAVYRVHGESLSHSQSVEKQKRFTDTIIGIEEYYLTKYPHRKYDAGWSYHTNTFRLAKQLFRNGQLAEAKDLSDKMGIFDFGSLKLYVITHFKPLQAYYQKRLQKRFYS